MSSKEHDISVKPVKIVISKLNFNHAVKFYKCFRYRIYRGYDFKPNLYYYDYYDETSVDYKDVINILELSEFEQELLK